MVFQQVWRVQTFGEPGRDCTHLGWRGWENWHGTWILSEKAMRWLMTLPQCCLKATVLCISARWARTLGLLSLCLRHEYRTTIKAFYAISGLPPLLPRWSLGNWWSRYYEYTAESYLAWLIDLRRYEFRSPWLLWTWTGT
jgi:hypothetical protein